MLVSKKLFYSFLILNMIDKSYYNNLFVKVYLLFPFLRYFDPGASSGGS